MLARMVVTIDKGLLQQRYGARRVVLFESLARDGLEVGSDRRTAEARADELAARGSRRRPPIPTGSLAPPSGCITHTERSRALPPRVPPEWRF